MRTAWRRACLPIVQHAYVRLRFNGAVEKWMVFLVSARRALRHRNGIMGLSGIMDRLCCLVNGEPYATERTSAI